MKTLRNLCLLGALFSQLSLGAVLLPKDSFNFEDRAVAYEKAIKDKKPIAYILYNPRSNCPLAEDALKAYLKAIGKRCVIIGIPSNSSTWKKELSKDLGKAIDKGKYTPKIVLIDPNDESVLINLLYEDYDKDDKKATRDLKKAIATATKK